MVKLICSVALIFVTFVSFGQNEEEWHNTNQFSVNFLMPSIEYEVAISEKSTIDLNLGTAFGYAKSGSNSDFGFFPVFQSQIRHFYNLKKRFEKGRNAARNSGNYIAALVEVRSGEAIIGELDLVDDYAFFAGPVWGLQRIYNSGFKLNLNLGAGYGINDSGDSFFSPVIGIQLGWLIKG